MIIFGILTVNTTSESFKARKIFLSHHFTFYEQDNFHTQLSRARKKFYNIGASADPEGGTGIRTPLKDHKSYGFL